MSSVNYCTSRIGKKSQLPFRYLFGVVCSYEERVDYEEDLRFDLEFAFSLSFESGHDFFGE